MKRLSALILGSLLLTNSAFGEESWGVKPDNFPTIMFKLYCLDTKGSNDSFNQKIKYLLDSKEIAPVDADSAAGIFGSADDPVWVFTDRAISKPTFIQGKRNGFCAVVTTGSLKNMGTVFDSAMSLHAKNNNAEFFRSGDVSFLNLENVSGNAFTIKMQDIMIYPIIFEEKNAESPQDELVIRMWAQFGKNKSTTK